MKGHIQKKFGKKTAIAILSAILVMSSWSMTVPSFAVVDDGTNSTISLLEDRSIQAVVEVKLSKDDLEKAIKDGTLKWKLSRTKGSQDSKLFPKQYLGDFLENWKTVGTDVESGGRPETNMFSDIKTTIVEENGKTNLKVEFNAKSLFGYNGIDGRDRSLVRNAILDYTGLFDLEAYVDKAAVGKTSLEIKPYDSFNTQKDVDEKLVTLAARANKAGLYAKVEEMGTSAGGRPMKAIFIAASSSDLENHKKLIERAKTEPVKVQEEVKAKTLSYKLPVMYSNVHADEINGVDSNMDFIEMLVNAAEKHENLNYKKINGLTATGQSKVKEEMKADGKVWSELIKDKATGVGYIQGNGKFEPTDPQHSGDASVDLTEAEMKQYYNIENTSVSLNDLLKDVFFIVVPSENVDARTTFTRTNANYFDLNRDNTYQTQPETRAMTKLIATWNPISLHELHGFYDQFQVEPCSPTHDPNAEYDLFMDNAMRQGEAFGGAAIANNETINSFQIPMRDYLTVDKDGKKQWVPFDDMSTSYTPQYAFLHGSNSYTVELPYGNQDAVDAIKFAFLGNADFVSKNKEKMYLNQLEFFRRGVENIDAETIRPYYVSQSDEVGVEADVFRKKYKENNNFFPEYYMIPMDSKSQDNRKAASEMVTYLLRNDVDVKALTEDAKINNKTYKKGTIVVSMNQAKRNMANAALYSNIVITDWTDLYSEPLTAFPLTRGFETDVITKKDAVDVSKLEAVETAPEVKTVLTGKGKYVVVSNNGVEAVKAINTLLEKGNRVGMYTLGYNKGDFIVRLSDFYKIKDDFTLDGRKTNSKKYAKKIANNIDVYVPGRTESPLEVRDGKTEYGVMNYNDRLNNELGWDLFALGDELGFDLTTNLKKADVIVGNQFMNEKEITTVKKGTPYIGYSATSLENAKEMGVKVSYEYGGIYDALTTVKYVKSDLITAKYSRDKDNIMYGYGGNYITKTPKGAKILIKTTKDDLIEGFMSSSHIKNYKDSIQAIEYKNKKMDLVLFANSLTNKAHQKDDYRYATNAIYERMLGGKY